MCTRTELIEIMEKSLVVRKEMIQKLEDDLKKLKEEQHDTDISLIQEFISSPVFKILPEKIQEHINALN